jgi:cysteine/O-acetylserine efflux protein
MISELIPLAAYILITTFTPGPNNITSTTAGASLGLKKSIPFLAGITSGVVVIMIISGYFNLFLSRQYSVIAGYIKWIGFFYMLWLAVSLFTHGKGKETRTPNFSFLSGMLLQLVNPKLILYGITLYGSFSKTLLRSGWSILISAIILTAVCFASILAWCLAGSAFQRFLKNKKTLLIFNGAMAALLLYSAFSIILSGASHG